MKFGDIKEAFKQKFKVGDYAMVKLGHTLGPSKPELTKVKIVYLKDKEAAIELDGRKYRISASRLRPVPVSESDLSIKEILAEEKIQKRRVYHKKGIGDKKTVEVISTSPSKQTVTFIDRSTKEKETLSVDEFNQQYAPGHK